MTAQHFNNGASFGVIRNILNGNADEINNNTAKINENTKRINNNSARISALENHNRPASYDYRWVKMSVKPGKDYVIADLYPDWEETIQGFYITVELDQKELDAAYIHIPKMTGLKHLTFIVCPNNVNRIAFDFMDADTILSPDNQLTIGTVKYMDSVTFKDFVARYKAASGIDLETYPQKEEYLPFQYRMDCVVMASNNDEIISVALTPLLTFRPTTTYP